MSDTEKSGGAARGQTETPWYLNGFWCNGYPVRFDPARPFDQIIHGEAKPITVEMLKAQLPPGTWREEGSALVFEDWSLEIPAPKPKEDT